MSASFSMASPRRTGGAAGVPIAPPRVLVETVRPAAAASAGSTTAAHCASVLGAPERPGPAAFGNGGTLPTVTDARGILHNRNGVGGGVSLDVDAAPSHDTRAADGGA